MHPSLKWAVKLEPKEATSGAAIAIDDKPKVQHIVSANSILLFAIFHLNFWFAAKYM